MPSSKLREVTSSSGGKATGPGRRSVNIFAENPIITGPRNSRSKKKLVEVNTSDEEDLEEEDVEEEEEEEGEEEEADSSEDAPGEEDDLDADGDIDMDDAPPQPPPKRHAKPAVTVTPAAKSGPIKEKKIIELGDEDDDEDDDDDDDEDEDDDDDEELSELESDAEGEPDESGAQDDELGEGGPEDEELDEEDDDEEGDGQRDSDEPTPVTGSRASTPDLSKLTKRQRGSLAGDFLQLPMGKYFKSISYLVDKSAHMTDSEPQVKKHLTAEEHAMRRAEMARRRKNLSEKRNEEEKGLDFSPVSHLNMLSYCLTYSLHVILFCVYFLVLLL
jgi:Ino eighty subunit 2